MREEQEIDVIKDIEHNLFILNQKVESFQIDGLERKWMRNIREEPKRFINPNLTVREDVLRNFRKLSIFVPDVPVFNPTPWNPKNILGGGRRGSRRLLMDYLDIIIKNGYGPLLKKYPCSPVGNPNIFSYKGYKLNERWGRHVYFLGLFKKFLGQAFRDDFVTLDIGSSYGIFSYLLKNEYERSHCVLLDFPEQLVLAHYFLAMNDPQASIASFGDVLKAKQLDRAFFEKYDFILVPLTRYKNIFAHSIDLVTNFVSFAEMNRNWFEYYTENGPFKKAKYFFTVNRIQSSPTYDSDITVLDYHLEEFKKIHFSICQLIEHTYRRKFLLFYDKYFYSSRLFEFIGERK